MKRQRVKNTQRFVLVLLVVLASVVVLFIAKQSFNERRDFVKEDKVPIFNNGAFISRTNKFSVDLSELSYQEINEDYNEVAIISDEGVIQIGKSSTNFEDVDGYVIDLAGKNNFTTTRMENILINGSPGIKTLIQYPESKRPDEATYFIYPTEWVVYTVSTDSPDLYDELDQIAQSFRYTP